jgi:hypothetical protein
MSSVPLLQQDRGPGEKKDFERFTQLALLDVREEFQLRILTVTWYLYEPYSAEARPQDKEVHSCQQIRPCQTQEAFSEGGRANRMATYWYRLARGPN